VRLDSETIRCDWVVIWDRFFVDLVLTFVTVPEFGSYACYVSWYWRWFLRFVTF
jgi:hypothetical protein